jgi:hypothetical protein
MARWRKGPPIDSGMADGTLRSIFSREFGLALVALFPLPMPASINEWLTLAVPDFGPHAAFLAADLASTFSRLFRSHAILHINGQKLSETA